MDYRITKDCGAGWDEAYALKDQATVSWGVSDNQKSLAKKVAPRDIFLHYIDHAHVWAGYSTVIGALCDNDESGVRLEALPYAVRIKRDVWLSKDQCQNTRDVDVPGLAGKHYHLRRAFTSISADEARLIIEAINSTVASQPKPSVAFDESWMADAESYYKGIVKGKACGKCRMCGENAESWIRRIPAIMATKEEVARMHDAFLDAAHIVPVLLNGRMIPENLRALCPNCHRIVDRLSPERRETLLRGIRLQLT